MKKFEYGAALLILFSVVHFAFKYGEDYVYLAFIALALGVFAYYRVPWKKIKLRFKKKKVTNVEHRLAVMENLIVRR